MREPPLVVGAVRPLLVAVREPLTYQLLVLMVVRVSV
jgi:hypothetical protein